jgi:hypothetical protein
LRTTGIGGINPVKITPKLRLYKNGVIKYKIYIELKIIETKNILNALQNMVVL